VHIVTLTTCFNRVDSTIRALKTLHQQRLPDSAFFSHYLVDDGSTDGTSEIITSLFPSVNIIHSPGNLYWAGGMRFGWSTAIQSLDYDFLFVYNDDVVFFENALAVLIDTFYNVSTNASPAVIAGSFLDSSRSYLTYGGVRQSSFWHPLRFSRVDPDLTAPLYVDTINMNGCLISHSIIDKMGFLASYFVHSGADFEYGLRLRANGCYSMIAPGFIGICDTNSAPNINQLCYRDRLQFLLGPKGQPMHQRYQFYSKYAGLFWPILFLLPYLRLLRP